MYLFPKKTNKVLALLNTSSVTLRLRFYRKERFLTKKILRVHELSSTRAQKNFARLRPLWETTEAKKNYILNRFFLLSLPVCKETRKDGTNRLPRWDRKNIINSADGRLSRIFQRIPVALGQNQTPRSIALSVRLRSRSKLSVSACRNTAPRGKNRLACKLPPSLMR